MNRINSKKKILLKSTNRRRLKRSKSTSSSKPVRACNTALFNKKTSSNQPVQKTSRDRHSSQTQKVSPLMDNSRSRPEIQTYIVETDDSNPDDSNPVDELADSNSPINDELSPIAHHRKIPNSPVFNKNKDNKNKLQNICSTNKQYPLPEFEPDFSTLKLDAIKTEHDSTPAPEIKLKRKRPSSNNMKTQAMSPWKNNEK
ncbi:MAG: hypothetical protein PF689_01875 [Deltaproteobacteria bacterium]|jgi:hypothetical protein|nr:hypothetical protein [Deltaproteobacteria bacterium]